MHVCGGECGVCVRERDKYKSEQEREREHAVSDQLCTGSCCEAISGDSFCGQPRSGPVCGPSAPCPPPAPAAESRGQGAVGGASHRLRLRQGGRGKAGRKFG